MFYGLCVGEEAGAGNLVFSGVKWLQPAMNVLTRNRFLHCVLQRAGANRNVMAACLRTWCCKTHCIGCMNVAWALQCFGPRVNAALKILKYQVVLGSTLCTLCSTKW